MCHAILQRALQYPTLSSGWTFSLKLKKSTFVDLAHDGELQVLLIVLLIVEAQQYSTQFGRQAEGGDDIKITESLESSRHLLDSSHILLHILQGQHVYH